MSLTGFGARALIPDELLEGYGYDAASDTYLIRPAIPLRGEVQDGGSPAWPNAWQTKVIVHWGLLSNFSHIRAQANRVLIWQAAYDAIMNGIGRVGEEPFPNPNFVFRWRPGGSPDGTAWTEIPGQYLGISLSSFDSSITAGNREIISVSFEDRRLNPSDPDYDVSTAALPASGTDIEFYLIGPLPPDAQHPIIIDGLTAGEFLANAYAGFYSERDPDTGAVIPTGIRYDEVAVKRITAQVMGIITKPIEDLRDWSEKKIYQPTGFVPALDDQALVSPVSQIPPDDLSALTVFDNNSAEATPEWSAGQTIINTIKFTYPRFFATDPPDPKPRFGGIPRQNILESIDVQLTFVDPLSVARHGEQVVEIDGSMFGAIGKVLDSGNELTWSPLTRFILRIAGRSDIAAAGVGGVGSRPRGIRPITDQVVVVSGKHIIPVSGDIANEVGYQLGLDRWVYLLDRYSFGAPTMRFPVSRAVAGEERAGSWVRLDLTHYPDYVKQRRGLEALAQIVALGEISCPWRRVVVEVVTPPSDS